MSQFSAMQAQVARAKEAAAFTITQAMRDYAALREERDELAAEVENYSEKIGNLQATIDLLQARVTELEGINDVLHRTWAAKVGEVTVLRHRLGWIADAVHKYDQNRRYATALRTIRHFVRDYRRDQP